VGGLLVAAADLVWKFFILGEGQRWLSSFHVIEMGGDGAHGCSGHHGGLGDCWYFYVKPHRKCTAVMYDCIVLKNLLNYKKWVFLK